MKFGAQLEQQKHEPWAEYYINYGNGKRIIKSIPEDGIDSSSEQYNQFVDYIEQELVRVMQFYYEKKKDFDESFNLYREIVLNVVPADPRHMEDFIEWSVEEVKGIPATYEGLQGQMIDLFVELELFRDFISLNFTGFRKIIKKFDKNAKNVSLQNWFSENILGSPISTIRFFTYHSRELALLRSIIFSSNYAPSKGFFSEAVAQKSNRIAQNDAHLVAAALDMLAL
ncbi:hypothetical protein PCE1_003454 [Barthelona sp. PCE]